MIWCWSYIFRHSYAVSLHCTTWSITRSEFSLDTDSYPDCMTMFITRIVFWFANWFFRCWTKNMKRPRMQSQQQFQLPVEAKSLVCWAFWFQPWQNSNVWKGVGEGRWGQLYYEAFHWWQFCILHSMTRDHWPPNLLPCYVMLDLFLFSWHFLSCWLAILD